MVIMGRLDRARAAAFADAWTGAPAPAPTVFTDLDALLRTLAGEQGAVRDIVLLNAAAALVAWRLDGDVRQKDRPLVERALSGLA